MLRSLIVSRPSSLSRAERTESRSRFSPSIALVVIASDSIRIHHGIFLIMGRQGLDLAGNTLGGAIKGLDPPRKSGSITDVIESFRMLPYPHEAIVTSNRLKK